MQEAQLALPLPPSTSMDESASLQDKATAVLQRNSDFLDELLGDSATATAPDTINLPIQPGKDSSLVNEPISDATADAVIQEVLNEELLDASDASEVEIIPVSALSDDSEAADEVIQEISDSLDRELPPAESLSEGQMEQSAGDAYQEEPATHLEALSSRLDSVSDESREAHEAAKEILENSDDTSDMAPPAEGKADEELQEQVKKSSSSPWSQDGRYPIVWRYCRNGCNAPWVLFYEV